MLRFNFDRLLKARGIDRAYSYFVKNGFGKGPAYRFSINKGTQLDLPTLERLCVLFRCTPNDLLEWKPDKGEGISEGHPLLSLYREEQQIVEMTKLLHSIPMEKMAEIQNLIRGELEK
ncbi:MAG: hypothetical protein H6Q14_2978 [Bacteroidetes bacterium]|nr:hypothetical protein [Bacteroidota bacterium]